MTNCSGTETSSFSFSVVNIPNSSQISKANRLANIEHELADCGPLCTVRWRNHNVDKHIIIVLVKQCNYTLHQNTINYILNIIYTRKQ